MFVVDDLVGWLIGRLAEAGYQKLSTWLRGSDQARALKAAVTAAVQTTADAISPAGQEQADRLAEQLNKAFDTRNPVPLPRGLPTLLERLQAGIAEQLSVLGDAGQPAVSLTTVPVTEVADRLTGQLVREIMIRGAQGGPLTPLAGQLNHDLTHLQGQRIEGQGQRIEGMLAQLLDLLGGAPAAASSAAGPVGWPLAEVADPFALEVHRPVEPDVPQPGLPVLPVYVPREHDGAVAEVVTAAAAGTSGIAVLVGGSSTGKTRACWQALELLRGLEPGWRLWHPIDSQGALAGLPGAGPQTVVWLNEAQRYLDTPGGTGEQVAAGLRELLRDRAWGPVLVLATLWPQFWDELTARPGGADLHAQARELLVGRDIQVPVAFTGEQLRELEGAGDPRLAQAASGSRDGQVIQYLAGAPELLDRYHNAPPAARALVGAAMDARRLGMGPALPRAFLEAAAPGYITDTDWDLLDDDWLEKALDYTAKPSKGVRGPLTPIRPRPTPGVPADPCDSATWQLADYLDQHGRRARRDQLSPPAFWAAAASYADPADLGRLGRAAEDHGLSRDAARLYKQASAHGNAVAGARLVRLLHGLHRGDQHPADWAAAYASLDDPDGLGSLLGALAEAGAAGQVSALLDRDPAAHASLDNPNAVAFLLGALRKAEAADQVSALATRAAAHASLDDPEAVAFLLGALRKAEAADQVSALATRAAAHASLDDPGAVADLLEVLAEAGAAGQVSALLDRDPAAHASLDNPNAVAKLLGALRKAEAADQVSALATRAAAHASLDNPNAVAKLLGALRKAEAAGQVSALLDRDPAAHASLSAPGAVAKLLGALRKAEAAGQVSALLDRDPAGHASLSAPGAVAKLLGALRKAEAAGQVSALLDRDPAAHASLDNPNAVAKLLGALRKAEAAGQVSALATRAAAHASLDNPYAVAFLLGALRKAGATGQVSALATRLAAHASLSDPGAVADLLDALAEAGATGQVSALATRAAAHASLDDPGAVAFLLGALRKAGATGQVSALATRLAAHASLDNPYAVAVLLDALAEAEATGQVSALATRAAAHASLDNPYAVADLLDALRKAGASAEAAELIKRLPAAGLFKLVCRQEDREDQFRFGWEADGRPAKRWAWTDLG